MKVVVNGTEREVEPGTTVAALVERFARSVFGTAVAIDGEVVPRSEWETRVLTDGDAIEVLSAVGGG